MRVFVDECVTRLLLPHLTHHDFVHIRDTPLRSTRNGALLRAVAPDYDVFLTTDRHIPAQQNLKKFDLVFVIMRGKTNDEVGCEFSLNCFRRSDVDDLIFHFVGGCLIEGHEQPLDDLLWRAAHRDDAVMLAPRRKVVLRKSDELVAVVRSNACCWLTA